MLYTFLKQINVFLTKWTELSRMMLRLDANIQKLDIVTPKLS